MAGRKKTAVGRKKTPPEYERPFGRKQNTTTGEKKAMSQEEQRPYDRKRNNMDKKQNHDNKKKNQPHIYIHT